MSRYFKFKSPEELAAAAAELNAPIEVSYDFSVLARPATVGGRTVGNRIAIHPMEGCDATLDGAPDELVYRRYQRFGAGGAKLIWGEATAVVPEGVANSRELVMNEANLPKFAKLVDDARRSHREALGPAAADDLMIGLQLTHSGRWSYRQPARVLDCPVLDAGGPTARMLSDDDLLRLQDAYVAAAERTARAGFDFVDVKQCHRYLLSELLAAKTRPGRFGGSLENRTRFVREVFARIRDAAPGLILATRMNVFDSLPFRKRDDGSGEPRPFVTPFDAAFGTDPNKPLDYDLTEPLEVIRLLRAEGLAVLNLSMACPYYNPHIQRPAEYPPLDGYTDAEHPLVGVGRHFAVTSAIQEANPELPVVGSGYSYLQEYLFHAGAANVAAGRVTFVGMGRAALAYPDAPRDLLQQGSLNRKSVCRTFSYCTNLMRTKNHPLGQFPTGCPPFDKEVYQPIYKDALAAQAAAVKPKV
ncbi:MAG: NADH:flavin oxidoreductase [Planctomycetia bacterium]